MVAGYIQDKCILYVTYSMHLNSVSTHTKLPTHIR
jgi:hypothetical protein